jgi:hypothetical protein
MELLALFILLSLIGICIIVWFKILLWLAKPIFIFMLLVVLLFVIFGH